MEKYFLFLLGFIFCWIFTCKGQNIDNIRGTNWISVDYIKDMENYLPCECLDKYDCYYISIASTIINEDRNEEEDDGDNDDKFPEICINYIIQTESRGFYIISEDSNKYVISGADGNWKPKIFELILVNDTLLLIDSISSKKFIKSSIPFDFCEDKYTNYLDNIILLNKSLSLRGYPKIQIILKADSLKLFCNAWTGNVNMISYYKKRKTWILEIKNGYLYIQKVLNPRGAPLDPLKTKVIKKLKWATNGEERQARREGHPVWGTVPHGVK